MTTEQSMTSSSSANERSFSGGLQSTHYESVQSRESVGNEVVAVDVVRVEMGCASDCKVSESTALNAPKSCDVRFGTGSENNGGVSESQASNDVNCCQARIGGGSENSCVVGETSHRSHTSESPPDSSSCEQLRLVEATQSLPMPEEQRIMTVTQILAVSKVLLGVAENHPIDTTYNRSHPAQILLDLCLKILIHLYLLRHIQLLNHNHQ